MPTSPAGKAIDAPIPAAGAGRATGFTLIELLVVVTILSILALGVGLVAGGGFSRPSNTPRALADRFAAAMTQARDAALLGRAPIGLVPRRDGWRVLARDAEGAWQSATAPVTLSGASLFWQVNGTAHAPGLALPAADATPPVLFLPDGRSNAFGLILGPGGGQSGARITCQTDGWGPVTCE